MSLGNWIIGLSALTAVLETHLQAEWSTPTQISSGQASINVTNHAMVIDFNSVASVGWLDGLSVGPGATTISSSSLSPCSATWSAPNLIYANSTDPSGPFLAFPVLGTDKWSNLTAAFALVTISPSLSITLNASRLPRCTSTWLPPTSQFDMGITSQTSDQDSDEGNFGALLSVSFTGVAPFETQFDRLPAKSPNWLPPISLGTDHSTVPATAIRVVKNKALLAWKLSPPLQILTMYYDFNTGSESSKMNIPLPDGVTDVTGFALATNESQVAVLTYVGTFPDNSTALYANILECGKCEWSAPVLISDPDHNIQFNGPIAGSIGMDRFGNSMIVWGEQVTSTQSFMRGVCFPNTGFPIGYTDLTNPNSLNTVVQPSTFTRVDLTGNAVASWVVQSGGQQQLQVASRPVSKAWNTPITLSTTASNPLIVLSEQETAVVVWIDTVKGVLMGSRDRALFPLTTPFGLTHQVIKNKYLSQRNFTLILNWGKVLAPNIHYQIFKDDRLIANVPGNQTSFSLRALPSVAGKYTVVAVASNGNRSHPVFIRLD